MTFIKYLKDRLLVLLGWAVLSSLLVFMVWLTPDLHGFWDNLGYLLILQLFLVFLFSRLIIIVEKNGTRNSINRKSLICSILSNLRQTMRKC